MNDAALKRMRKICLGFPDTDEANHFGDISFRVKKKMFASFGDQIVFGLEPDHAITLVDQDQRFTHYPRDKRAVQIDVDQVEDWDALAALLKESYDLVATAKKKPSAKKGKAR